MTDIEIYQLLMEWGEELEFLTGREFTIVELLQGGVLIGYSIRLLQGEEEVETLLTCHVYTQHYIPIFLKGGNNMLLEREDRDKVIEFLHNYAQILIGELCEV